MAITVTATGSGGTPYAFCSLTVLVLTGATEAGGASAAVQNVSVPDQTPVTPNASNSLVCWAAQNETIDTAFTPAANNASLNSASDSGTGTAYMQGYYSGAVTASTPVTAGTATPSSAAMTIAAYEVKPSGGSTPVRDSSAPAPVNPASAVATTASFTPPGGAVLVALVSSPGGAAGGFGLTVADSSGLAWTRRAQIYPGANSGYSAVFTATTPVAGAATLSGTGSLATAATQHATASLAAAGTLTTAGTQAAGASLAGTATVTAPPVTQSAGAILQAAAAFTAAAAQAGPGTLAGAGALAAPPVAQAAGAALAGAASLATASAVGATATLAGAAAVTAAAGQRAGTALAAAGNLAAAPVQATGAALGAEGSLTATATTGEDRRRGFLAAFP